MQTVPPLRTWTDLFIFLIGTAVGLIPTLVTAYRNRKRSSLEEADLSARTDLTRANIQISTGEGVSKMLTTLIEAGDTIKHLQGRVFELEQENIRFSLTKLDMKKAKALLDYHGIPFSAADEPEMKKRLDRSKG